MKYIGIDIGGMSIKGGVVDSEGHILCKDTIITQPEKEGEAIVADIATLITSLMQKCNLSKNDIGGVGIGSPGSVYDQKGVIRYSCNINFKNTPIVAILQKTLGIDNIKVSNDANCAALGECKFGAAKGAQNMVMITLGTGVGTGIIVDGRLLTGNKSAGSEGGHIQINIGGKACGCGKKGHYEAYASASALLAQVSEACDKYPQSVLAQVVQREGKVSGFSVFEAVREGCPVAKRVLARYIKYVGMGLVCFANIFFPESIVIGGGISNEGDALIKPLQRYVSRNVYGAKYNPHIKVVSATLKNDAGIIGAAALTM